MRGQHYVPDSARLRVRIVTSLQPSPQRPAVLPELADKSPDFRLTGELLETSEQCGALSSQQERRQGRHDVLDQAKRRFAPQTDRDEIVKCRRKCGAETIELGADQRLARGCFCRAGL